MIKHVCECFQSLDTDLTAMAEEEAEKCIWNPMQGYEL